ncbi:uncharacterized protein [Miscanthus floridulus]|uniref:uncharacterized protein n=1 Tax=Miscanthus floridulus TaxID=154761 RepID=UPI003457FBE4
MVAEHGGAMAVGGEARGGSTCARKAAQARARLEGGRGGVAGHVIAGRGEEAAANCAGGCVARRATELGALGSGGRRGSAGGSERAHGHQQVKASAWARVRPRLPRGGRRRHMVATRREFSAAVGAWTSGQQGNGAGLGRGERSVGWHEQAGARGGPTRAAGSLARWAGFGRRPEARAAAREGEKSFSK